MKITYILPNRTCEIKGETLFSPLASERYRIINPSEELHKRGHEVNMNFEPVRGSKVDVVFMGKFLYSPKPWIDTIKEYKDMGAKIVWDICDNYIEQYKKTAEFKQLLDMTDVFTAPSKAMYDTLWNNFTQTRIPEYKFAYIPDAPEMPYGKVNGFHLQFLWYGNTKNLQLLKSAKFPVNSTLQLVTSPSKEVFSILEDDVNVTLTPWSLDAMRKALKAGQYVVLPADLTDPWYLTKSANRAFEAIWTGNYVLANRIPEYEHVNLPAIHFVDGYDFRLPGEKELDIGVFDKIDQSQEIIREKYLIDKTVVLWEKALG